MDQSEFGLLCLTPQPGTLSLALGRVQRPRLCPLHCAGQRPRLCPLHWAGQGPRLCLPHWADQRRPGLRPVLGRSQKINKHLTHVPLGLWTAASTLFSVSLLLGWNLIFHSTPEESPSPPFHRSELPGERARCVKVARLFRWVTAPSPSSEWWLRAKPDP